MQSIANGVVRDERGLSMAEYAIVLALVSLVALGGWAALGGAVDEQVDCAADAISGRSTAGPCGEGHAAPPPGETRPSEPPRGGPPPSATSPRPRTKSSTVGQNKQAATNPATQMFPPPYPGLVYDRVVMEGDETRYYIGEKLVAKKTDFGDHSKVEVFDPRSGRKIVERTRDDDGSWTDRATRVSGDRQTTVEVRHREDGSVSSVMKTVYERCNGCFGANPDGWRMTAQRWTNYDGGYSTATSSYDARSRTRTVVIRTFDRNGRLVETMTSLKRFVDWWRWEDIETTWRPVNGSATRIRFLHVERDANGRKIDADIEIVDTGADGDFDSVRVKRNYYLEYLGADRPRSRLDGMEWDISFGGRDITWTTESDDRNGGTETMSGTFHWPVRRASPVVVTKAIVERDHGRDGRTVWRNADREPGLETFHYDSFGQLTSRSDTGVRLYPHAGLSPFLQDVNAIRNERSVERIERRLRQGYRHAAAAGASDDRTRCVGGCPSRSSSP